MKKTLKLMGLCALAVLALAGCKKEQNAVTFRATLTQPTSNAKTHIGNNDSLVWNEGDAIKVYTADKANSALCTTTDNNKPVADFTVTEGTLPGTGSFLAFYPATAVEETENGFKLPLSATQTYVENNFATNTYPMYAASDNKNFSFQSPYALLAIPIMSLSSSTTVGSIELTSNTPGQKLSGYYEVSTAGTCGTTLLGDGAETITLNCPGGLELGTTAKTVCFVVPAGVFANGFKAVLKNTTGGELYTLAASGNNLTAAQTILLMNPVSISSITVTTGTAEPDPTDPTKYILHGSYSAPQGTSVDEVGFYYGEGATLTQQSVTPTGNNFSLTITVAPGHTYTYKAYAKNGNNEIVDETGATSFTVFEAPTVSTGEATATSGTTATGHVTLTNAGTTSTSDIELGICWGTTANPEVSTTTNNHASVSGTPTVGTPCAVGMTGLTASTPYYVRGYAKIGDVYYYDTTAGETVNFTTPAAIPVGAIGGLFTVSVTGDVAKKVYFSKGNLQYIGSASTPYWKFADNQWDYIGATTGQGGSSPTIDRDLFGWGTSGYNHGATAYQPWATSTTEGHYKAYGNSTYDLYSQTPMTADWGYNAISNGGNTVNSGWRTLTNAEWNYVFNSRTTTSGIRYAKAVVNNVNGVILLPDDWNTTTYTLNNANSASVNYTGNNITATDWINVLEANGAVFLPAAGYRQGAELKLVGNYGDYWSSTHHTRENNSFAYSITFSTTKLSGSDFDIRRNGISVRLVQDYTPGGK